MKTGQNKSVRVWDNKYGRYEEAQIVGVRENVRSSFDSHIYPKLYDVVFLHDGRLSEGHLPFAVSE